MLTNYTFSKLLTKTNGVAFFVDFSKPIIRIECLRLSLSYAIGSKFIFELYASEAENVSNAMLERMEYFENLLQTVLKKAIKTSMKLPTGNATNYFKSVYALTLRKPEKLNGLQMARHLVQLLQKMENVSDDLSP